MTKAKLTKVAGEANKPASLDELMKALIATPEAQEILARSDLTTYMDLFKRDNPASQMVGRLLQEMLNAEMTEHLGYPKHNPAGYLSGNSRNGSYPRTLRTSQGPVELDMPRDRAGTFASTVVPPYRQISEELEETIIALYGFGTSTKDIVEFIAETYHGLEVSEGFVSTVTNSILDLAREWQSRPLAPVYAICYLDAIHVKAREEGRVVTKAVHIIMGYDLEGHKDILGHYIASGAEGAKFWLSAITDLKNRGVQDILIAAVDGLSGFEQAIQAVFPHTVVQRCVVHAIRNSLAYIPHKYKDEFMADLRPVYTAATKLDAEAALRELEARWGEKYPMAIAVWRNNWEALTQYFDYSPEIRRMIYTTNPIESYNSVLRKFTKNKRSFVSDEALRKVLYLATQRASKHWDKCIPNWPTILNQLAIAFAGRIPMV